MVVRTQSSGRGVSGLLLRKEDVRRHIPKNTVAIELQLGELCIDCPLPPEFWLGRPEICDRRLRDWLEFKILRTRTCRLPMVLEMTPIGNNSFRLQVPAGCDGAEAAVEKIVARTASGSEISSPDPEPPIRPESTIASHLV